MLLRSITEAYTFTLLQLQELKKAYPNHVNLTKCIEKIKVLSENHEQAITPILGLISNLKTSLPGNRKILNHICEQIIKANYSQTDYEKFCNPLARRAESEFALALLYNPTDAMMHAVQRVSTEILNLIENLERTGSHNELLKNFLNSLDYKSDALVFGATKDRVSLERIKNILRNNDPKQLSTIMHIHFKCAKQLSRGAPFETAAARQPVGKLLEIIKSLAEEYPVASTWKADPTKFFTAGLKHPVSGSKIRGYIADEVMYQLKLYTTENYKGRKGRLKQQLFSQTGLMLPDQDRYAINLPYEQVKWIPDCKGQDPDFESQYVRDLIYLGAVYVSGPSGMTSLLLGQMEFLVNFESEALKQIYLSAVVAYIVGGGFHGIHEVLGPAQYCLDLVPGYHVSPPIKGKLPLPPNYNQFFTQQTRLDPEFRQRREEAWQHYLDFAAETYAKEQGWDLREAAAVNILLTPETQQTIGSSLQQYIDSRSKKIDKDNLIELNFISKHLRDKDLTAEKVALASTLMTDLANQPDYYVACEKIGEAIVDLEILEKMANKVYYFGRGSDLLECLKELQTVIGADAKNQLENKADEILTFAKMQV